MPTMSREWVNRLPAIDQKTAIVLFLILDEVKKATEKFPIPYHSAHEFKSVLDEEVFEVQTEVYGNKIEGSRGRLVHETTQVAAVCMKFLANCCSGKELEDEARARGLIS